MANDGFYWEATKIIAKVRAGKGKTKSLCYASKQRNKPGLYALVTETLKNYDILGDTLEESGYFQNERKMKIEISIVLLQELVGGKKHSCSSALWMAIERHREKLLEVFKAKYKHTEDLDTLRYVRVNTLICTLEECKESLSALGYKESECLFENETSLYTLDIHIPHLLVFPPSTDLTKTELYKSGKIILQDKASCFPAYILNVPPGGSVMDTCSAPGNKTTHLASLMGSGHIIAFEKDPERHEILKSTIAKHVTEGDITVECVCADFLEVDPEQHGEITHALLDPSCSGSGIFKSYEHAFEDPDRLKNLASFQLKIIEHAMKFPSLERLTYSTCSVHVEENESVVDRVLKRNPNWSLYKSPLPTWHRRGDQSYTFSNDVIRVDPIEDRMNGFFVACFIKNKLK